jgi:predicted dehydrogenase
MSKRSLVVGMGIGQLYKTVLEKLGHEVITVDSDISKGAMLPTVESAMLVHAPFDTVHICTPNFTHEVIARTVARFSKIVFIEKPGVIDSKCWQCLVEDFPNTRFMMVKNNMWRTNIKDLLDQATHAKQVHIRWIRKNCIPSPGSWFTTRELSFGGVSRDLMPHLLSLFVALNTKWHQAQVNGQTAMACWQLKDIESTEYGVVNPNGTYDVDDMCVINFGNKWKLSANWRSMDEEDSSIKFIMEDNSVERFELGWCPEEAYHNMIVDALENINNEDFWSNQYNIDKWIHERIENL